MSSASGFERKDEIRHRLRCILRLTASKQKSRLIGLAGLTKKGFHCRTREELVQLDELLTSLFPDHMASSLQITSKEMEEKLAAAELTRGVGACARRVRAMWRRLYTYDRLSCTWPGVCCAHCPHPSALLPRTLCNM
jgi:hypothetical protein